MVLLSPHSTRRRCFVCEQHLHNKSILQMMQALVGPFHVHSGLSCVIWMVCAWQCGHANAGDPLSHSRSRSRLVCAFLDACWLVLRDLDSLCKAIWASILIFVLFTPDQDVGLYVPSQMHAGWSLHFYQLEKFPISSENLVAQLFIPISNIGIYLHDPHGLRPPALLSPPCSTTSRPAHLLSRSPSAHHCSKTSMAQSCMH